MKVAISASDPDLTAFVDPRFGRCPWFMIADTESNESEVLGNPGISAPGGAGIKAAQAIA